MLLLLVILFPLLGAILNGFVLPRNNKLLSQIVASSAVGLAFVCSVFVFAKMLANPSPYALVYGFDWLKAGPLNVPFELIIDRLSGLMLLIVTGIGTLIHIYAGGYMHEEKTTYRFFSYLNLFVFMMLLLVCGNNLLVMFVGWEGVGLCSYLLIGYWFENEDNAKAGTKAFIVNRIGDIGFLLGIFITYQTFHTLTFTTLLETVRNTTLSTSQLANIGWLTLFFFIGACGKSAQLPLYVWLPDAMAGPTPVSALIHAATMVTAGIYMMTRMHFFYYLAPTTLMVVAWIGVLTALFAASIALVQTDIKKVLAYSTVSQLGFMVLACGVGAFDAGVFHLFTHACFKALLFLGAGSVIVAMHHKQDMLEMGGLKKYMPITHAVMLIGVLAIIGFPGLAGFFSKDEILWKAFIYPKGGPILWFLAALAAACTSFYMVRLLCLTFYGDNRSDKKTRSHLHEVPSHMWGPLVILALLSILVGYLGVPPLLAHLVGGHNIFAAYLEKVVQIPVQAKGAWVHLFSEHSHATEWALMLSSVAIVFVSSYVAIKFYANGPSKESIKLKEKFHSAHRLLTHKYRVDEIYHTAIVAPLYDISVFLWKIFDVRIINGIVNGVGQFFMLMSGLTSFRMTGSLQRYALLIATCVAIFLFALIG